MARISEAELQHIKQAVSLVTLAKQQGHELSKKGKELVTLCPFHKEKTPSMHLNPDRNLFHCFGCSASGSVLDWLMQTEKISLRKAYEQLRASLGGGLELPALAPVATLEQEASRQALLREVLAFYQQTLLTEPEAQHYLKSRKLHDPELVSHFKLGYSNRTLAYRLPSKQKEDGARLRKQLQKLGLLRESGHEQFRGCLVIPVIDNNDQIGELYGRKINRSHPLHLYLDGPHQGIFNEVALLHHKSIILCEALIDALSFWVAGQRNVTAAYGVHGLTADHWRLFEENGVRQILIAFDNDGAGNDGALKLAGQLQAKGIEAWRILFPAGQDANDYLCSQDEPEAAFQILVEQAQPLLDRGSAESDPSDVSTEPADPLITSSLAASPEPVSHTAPGMVYQWQPNGDLRVDIGRQQWRLRGLRGHWRYAVSLKLNLQLLDKTSGALFTDNLDLLSARSRQGYARQAANELGLLDSEILHELGQLLLLVEQLASASIESEQAESATVVLTEDDQQTALALLKSPDLIGQIRTDLAACGVVGESNNLLAAYLAASSRRLNKPLAVLIQSSSAAGKSSLMEAVLNLMPAEERLQYSAMTGQSLFYLGETDLRHKILAIAEEEGVRQAAYALKLLQSDGELTIASTAKDEATGNLVTKQYTVEGPVMLMLTTTAIDVDEELLNRCLVLTVNESRAQTEAIHTRQRQSQTLAGLLQESEKERLTELHQNAQRLLKPVKIVNPYANQLTFISDKTRTRRDHMKYLTLIQSITLLHQYQRPVKHVEHQGQPLAYIEVSQADIQLANELAHDLLGRTLDELPPQTRQLLLLIRQMVLALAKEQQQKPQSVRFTRRDIRAFTQWSDSQLKLHCVRLTEMEYLLVHGGSRGHLLRYELLWDGDNPDETRLCGLIDLVDPMMADSTTPASLG